jgi:hypothetical protein
MASPRSDCGAWDILQAFAASDMTLPEVEEKVKKKHLGDQYHGCDWQPALNAVMKAEGDVLQVQEAIQQLSLTSQLPCLTIKLSPL